MQDERIECRDGQHSYRRNGPPQKGDVCACRKTIWMPDLAPVLASAPPAPPAGPASRDEAATWRQAAVYLRNRQKYFLDDEDAKRQFLIAADDFERFAKESDAATPPVSARQCKWAEDQDGVWITACRKAWASEAGGTPADHGMVWCYGCGAKLEAAVFVEAPVEADPA